MTTSAIIRVDKDADGLDIYTGHSYYRCDYVIKFLVFQFLLYNFRLYIDVSIFISYYQSIRFLNYKKGANMMV